MLYFKCKIKNAIGNFMVTAMAMVASPLRSFKSTKSKARYDSPKTSVNVSEA